MKIIKSDETECDDLKEIENNMKSEYYKTRKIIYKEMEDFFFMSVLKCDRTFTQLTIDDKIIILKIKFIYLNKSRNIPRSLYFFCKHSCSFYII